MERGTYCLLMKLKEKRNIKIGRKGVSAFPGGFYCYVGSAMNGLEKRMERHMSREKRLHWHIDWFLRHAEIVDVKRIISDERLECIISRGLEGIADSIPMEGFGSSDCRTCRSHLYYFRENPSEKLDELVGKWKV
jgi:Uri superfamily endonuclease